MDLSRTVYGIIGVLVAVLMIATVAVPVVDSADDALAYHNVDTAYPYTEFRTGDVIEFVPGTLLINGVDMSDRLSQNWLKCQYVLGALDGLFIVDNSGYTNVALTKATFTVNSDRTITVVYSTSNQTDVSKTSLINEWGFIASNEGRWTEVYAGPEIYINDIDQIYTSGPLAGGLVSTVGDKIYFNGVEQSTKVQLSSTEVDDNVYKFSSVLHEDYVVAVDSSATPLDIRVYVVPVDVYSDESPIALLTVTVLILFLVPIMMIVRMIAGRAD